ncbi:MAG: M15 family metallopeptidase, partial [Erysipelotrichaceae bacterium]|nr:M15 family metallopeptidase [Erysipelotrichaceae bacterium]
LTLLVFLTACSYQVKDSLLSLGYSEEDVVKIRELDESVQTYFESSYNKQLLDYLNNENFEASNMADYLKYSEYGDTDTVIFLVNNGYFNNELTVDLFKDKWFIMDNLDSYLKYGEVISDVRSLVEYVNTRAYLKGYEDYKEADTDKGNLIIANKLSYLGDYVPDDLVNVDGSYCMQDGVMLKSEAYEHLKQMFEAAREEDYYFYISTAYRSYDFQKALYDSYLLKDSAEVVDSYSSRPGFSDHQTGLACDIGMPGYKFEMFTDTDECRWLHENAYKYGFILRYPEGKENITKYKYESWHFRYVGVEVSTYIYENNITLEEYVAYFGGNR